MGNTDVLDKDGVSAKGQMANCVAEELQEPREKMAEENTRA